MTKFQSYLTGIEIVLGMIAERGTESSNRTLLELKFIKPNVEMPYLAFQSYLTGIEIVIEQFSADFDGRFQSYLTGIEILADQRSDWQMQKFQSYLTGIEIQSACRSWISSRCSNRTLLELKYPLLHYASGQLSGSNRTLLELKFFVPYDALLPNNVPIVPYWN